MMITRDPTPCPMHVGLLGKRKSETTVLKLWVTFQLSNNNLCDFLLCCYRAFMQTSNASVFPSGKWVQQSLPCPSTQSCEGNSMIHFEKSKVKTKSL